jgi:hypothetical protein
VNPVANPSKRKGSSWEIAINGFNKAFAHLAGVRWVSHRNPPAGTVDVGDVELVTERLRIVVEAKAEQRIDLAGYMRELAVEVANYEKREGHAAHGVVAEESSSGKGVCGDGVSGFVEPDCAVGGDGWLTTGRGRK